MRARAATNPTSTRHFSASRFGPRVRNCFVEVSLLPARVLSKACANFFLTFTTSGESSGPGGNTTEPRGAKEGNEKWEMPEKF